MKKRKILSMFLLVFTLFGVFNFFNPSEVKAATYNETLSHPKTPNVYYTRRGGGKPYMSAQYEQYTMNGKVVYCIEPGVDITTHDYSGAIGWINSPYSNEINQKIHNDKVGFITQCDEVYAQKIQDVADLIKNNIDFMCLCIPHLIGRRGPTERGNNEKHLQIL